ncbi:glycoside hydrolase family 3 C-terminal domain-containing protein [Frankia sp. CcI49]|uniref:glycoside hydrolase family 3 C-terminal domain-containing protein n=1 Tax=Frankia sp. CcI49 TaxID=1745382 RepID=UPI001F52A67C|nr:glycoside hydrolase family 3 C-terminal domain-containing protein [Frankia sp. CcI49]
MTETTENQEQHTITLTTEQMVTLLSGRDTWSTQPVESAGIRSVRLSDGPHGLRVQEEGGDPLGFLPSLPATCFPPAVALGSSWDPGVVAKVGEALGREAQAAGIDIILGPGVNIKRSPLCGRNFEYLSEDPLLSGVLGAAYVKGVQSTGVGASVKHFAANNQETDRMRVSADVDERTLREIYLPAFERVVKEAEPATVMCAYNKINGVYGSENRWLLTEVLRRQWGFTGAVVSDWGAVHDPAAAVRAGVDLEMPGTRGRSVRELMAAVVAGELDEAVVSESAERVRRLGRYGLGETNAVDPDAHHAIAREAASACTVLLKNEDVLPLSPDARIVVIGEFARTPRFQGGGSSHVNATRIDSFLCAAEEHARGPIEFAAGYDVDGDGDPRPLREAAVTAAAACEVAVIFVGLGEADESEGFDRTSIDLPEAQTALIRAVSTVSAKTVVVLSHGGVVGLEGWHDDVDAIVDGFLLGQAGGSALAEIIYGVVNPSGKLAETIPMRLEDTASFTNFPGEQGHVVYGERLFVGYRSVATTGVAVRYPFGHGLSYTTFRVRRFQVSVTGSDRVTVSVAVENVGDRDGAHVIQIYVDASSRGFVQRPARELRAFAKVFIPAGRSADLELALDRRAFAYWDTELSDWCVTPGEYRVILGRDALTSDAEETVILGGDHIVRELTLRSTVQEWFDHPVVGPILLETLESKLLFGLAQPGTLRVLGSLPMQKIVNLVGEGIPPGAIESLMAMTVHSEK